MDTVLCACYRLQIVEQKKKRRLMQSMGKRKMCFKSSKPKSTQSHDKKISTTGAPQGSTICTFAWTAGPNTIYIVPL